MFNEIEQGREIYGRRLGEYAALVNDVKASYPENWDPMLYSKRLLRKLEAWNARLGGMAEALGLNEKEIGDFFAEVGIKYQYRSEEPESEKV